MDITVYLPDELGKLAKENELNFSRLLRDAVTEALQEMDVALAPGYVTVEEATALIADLLKDGKWHKRRDFDEIFEGKVRYAHYGHAKRVLGIEHRRAGWGDGSSFQWRLPKQRNQDA